MKRRLGISIYPEQSTFEKDKKYLEIAKKLGYEIVFTSILHYGLDEDFDKKTSMVFKSIAYAKSLGFYIILDVEQNSMNKANIDKNFLKCKTLGVDCVRLDTPLRASEIAFATHNEANIDIQLNMSSNDNLLETIMDFKPIQSRLSGCHNFYPLKYTGLPFNFFKECNKRFLKHRLETSAFVASHAGEMTTAVGWKELPTLELQRNLAIVQQAKILFYTDEIDNLLIGNAYATETELKLLAEVEKYRFTFDIKKEDWLTKEEEQIILSKQHFRRGDISEYFIRSSMTRILFKELKITPNNKKVNYHYGDVVVINDNDKKYKGELHIILKNDFKDEENKYNFVGKIIDEEKILIDYLKANSHFRFKFI